MEKKPFFLMANSHDPYRPFAGSDQEARQWGEDPPEYSRKILPEEVRVPPFLPDLPEVRREVAEYMTSAHRCDETVDAVLAALKESGFEDNTLVMFISDNGMSFPFAKAICCLTSTKTPWIARWPGKIRPGNRHHHGFHERANLEGHGRGRRKQLGNRAARRYVPISGSGGIL